MGTRMLTNPSPNARTPRAVSRRRTLRGLRRELFITGTADVGVFQEFRGALGAIKRLFPEMGLWAAGLGCAALWSWCPRCSRLVGDFPCEHCQRAPESDCRADPSGSQLSGPDVRSGV